MTHFSIFAYPSKVYKVPYSPPFQEPVCTLAADEPPVSGPSLYLQAPCRRIGLTPIAKAICALLLSGLLWASFCLLCATPATLHAEENQEKTIQVIHTVGTAEGFCPTTTTIAAPTGTDVYYCFTIVNNNPVTLTNHTFVMPLLGITNTFESVIPPGEKLAVTTGYLASIGIFLNPGLTAQMNSQSITNTVTVFSAAQDEDEFNYTGQGTARVILGEAQTELQQTVGTNEGSCADSASAAVAGGTTVYYCLTITNTGTLDFVRHEVRAPQLGATFVYTPTDPTQSTQKITAQDVRQNYPPNLFAKEINGAFTNAMTVTSYTSEGILATSSATAQVVVGNVTMALTYTVGTVADGCATTTTTVVPRNNAAYYCVKLKNTGTLPLTRFTLAAPQLSLQRSFTQTLNVGETLVLTRSFDSHLEKVITANDTSTLTVDAYTANDIHVAAQGTATASAGALLISVVKYARTNPSGCNTGSSLSISSTTQFYYCVVIKNTGTIPVERFTVAEPSPTNINFSFDYHLEPNQTITLTNEFLANTLQLGSLLGPFVSTFTFNASLTVTAIGANSNPVPVSA
ncbi:MAG: hypothetical protein KDE19_07770, partial [Caldilineaceae bacterium]|nr:hypothetical protein [Caldilineaceae bacterium]